MHASQTESNANFRLLGHAIVFGRFNESYPVYAVFFQFGTNGLQGFVALVISSVSSQLQQQHNIVGVFMQARVTAGMSAGHQPHDFISEQTTTIL